METGLLSCIESRIEKNGSLYGRFELAAFKSGQALTFANALRRTLLSQISGLAIVAVDIQGIKHEYSNFIGMRESVLDFLLNLKKIILTTETICIQPQMGSLVVRGPAVVRASDLKLPNSLSCVDPNQYLATLAVNGVLQITFYVCQGRSFSFTRLAKELKVNKQLKEEVLFAESTSENKTFTPSEAESFDFTEFWTTQALNKKKSNRTLLDLEPIFMPITKVNFVIQSQPKSDEFCEKIILEIWTNGSIQPKTALSQAIKELLYLFSSFQPSFQRKSKFLKTNVQNLAIKNVNETHFLCLDIANLDFSLRCYTLLKRLNINTIGDLVNYSVDPIVLLKKLGKQSFQEVEKIFSQNFSKFSIKN
jgi:DNA-directed RNA polymerase subunit alpha